MIIPKPSFSTHTTYELNVAVTWQPPLAPRNNNKSESRYWLLVDNMTNQSLTQMKLNLKYHDKSRTKVMLSKLKFLYYTKMY
jgi:hypothetical protein